MVDAVELFKDVGVNLGVEVNCFDCGGGIGYACGRGEYFAGSTPVSFWLVRGESDDADVLYETCLKQFLDMHLLAPVENFIRLSEAELVNKRGGAIHLSGNSNSLTNRSE